MARPIYKFAISADRPEKLYGVGTDTVERCNISWTLLHEVATNYFAEAMVKFLLEYGAETPHPSLLYAVD